MLQGMKFFQLEDFFMGIKMKRIVIKYLQNTGETLN